MSDALNETVTITGLGYLGFFSVVTVTIHRDISGFGFVILDGPGKGETGSRRERRHHRLRPVHGPLHE